MYDFCFTYSYATLLALGGCFGYASKGGLPSLFGGLGSAAVLAICAQISLNAYHAVRPLPCRALGLFSCYTKQCTLAVDWNPHIQNRIAS